MNNIKKLRQKKRLSARELGLAIGKSQSTISKWEKKEHLKYDDLKRLANYFKVSIRSISGEAIPTPFPQSDMVAIDIINAQDIKANNNNPNIIGRQMMPLTLLQEFTQSSPQDIKILRINSDTMTPTIRPNEMIWVNTAIKTAHTDGIYLLFFGDNLVLKRIQVNPIENSGLIISDNPQYENLPFNLNQNLHIYGKVIYHIQKLS